MIATISATDAHTLAHLDGQAQADKYCIDLSTRITVGDDLHHLISKHMTPVSPLSDEFLRGFLRRIEKHLEGRP